MFDSVVFAGGGHRCWWQLGWWEVVAEHVHLAPRQIAGVSAGAATACVLYASSAQTALTYYRRVLGAEAKNFYPAHLIRRGQKVMPHEGIYRAALAELLGGSAFTRLMSTAPVIRILYARPPRWVPPSVAVGGALMAYTFEKYWLSSLHPRSGVKMGFKPEVAVVQDCADEQTLIDLIIASSATPPFTSVQRLGGLPVLDGGLIDNVPVAALAPLSPTASSEVDSDQRSEELREAAIPKTLVLATRRYKKLDLVFERDDRLYVQPSRKVDVSSWDYANPDAYASTFEQGRQDAQHFLDYVKKRTRK